MKSKRHSSGPDGRHEPLTLDYLFRQESGDRDTGHGPLRVALAYPNTYAVGMASLGFHQVRQRLSHTGFARVERAFLEPDPTRTIETNALLTGFHLLAFSVAYELDYLNILRILEANGIPLFAEDRKPYHPLVLVGGVAVLVNRHPIYPFADLLAHGESEDMLEPVARALAENLRDSPAALGKLQGIPGVEITAGAWRRFAMEGDGGMQALVPLAGWVREDAVPAGTRLDPPEPAEARDPMASAEPSLLVTPHAELGERVLVEIARGCPHRCTFCWVGHNCREFMAQSAAKVLELCDEGAEVTGCESVGLISAAVAAHPEIGAICEGLLSRGRQLSFSSLRAEEVQPAILNALVRSGQLGLTLAPETGSERLRRLLGKSLPDDAFFEAVDAAQKAGLSDLKLYFMTGLPTETDADAEEMVGFVDRVRRIMHAHGRRRGRLGDLSINLGIYIAKPHTPLARMEAPPFAAIRQREERVRRRLASLPNVRVASANPEQAAAQYVLSNSGFEAAALLYSVWKQGGNWKPALRDFQRREKSGE